MGPPTPIDRDYVSLGQLWDTLREKKARQMAKEVPKVKSLEDGTREPDREVPHVVQHLRAPSPTPMPEETYKPGPSQKVKKRKSMYVFLLTLVLCWEAYFTQSISFQCYVL